MDACLYRFHSGRWIIHTYLRATAQMTWVVVVVVFNFRLPHLADIPQSLAVARDLSQSLVQSFLGALSYVVGYVTRIMFTGPEHEACFTYQRPRLWSTLLVQLTYEPLLCQHLPFLRSLFLHILQTVYMDFRGPD
jgi:hypothetical protein